MKWCTECRNECRDECRDVLPKSDEVSQTNMRFEDLIGKPHVYLYAGGLAPMTRTKTGKEFVGLDPNLDNDTHIPHDVRHRMSLPNNIVDIYQSEDVHEHIEYDQLTECFNEIYRVLKPNGLFRLSLPDYMCDVLSKRSHKNSDGDIYHDPGGGGYFDYTTGKVEDGGHLWFPDLEKVDKVLKTTRFKNVNYLHYYNGSPDTFATHPIDYSMGYISRTPDHDKRVQNPRRPMSLVVDCRKE